MADYHHHSTYHYNPKEGKKGCGRRGGPSASKVIAVASLLPIGGTLLTLSGLTLTGTLIAMAVATPVFLLFSLVIVPAPIALSLAIIGFLTLGAFGVTALSSLSCIANMMRGASGSLPEQLEYMKLCGQDAVADMKFKL